MGPLGPSQAHARASCICLPHSADLTLERSATRSQAWSKACTLALALLAATQPPSPTAFTGSLPPPPLSYTPTLATHLRGVILFEPSTTTLGLPPTADFLAALGPALSAPPSADHPHALATALGEYVASYGAGVDASAFPASSIGAVQAIVGEDVWQPEAIATAGWELAVTAAEAGVLAREALVGSGVPIGLLYGTATVGFCSEAARVVEGWWREVEAEGKGGRRAVQAVQGMNHVGQVLRPKLFAAAVLELIAELDAKK